MANVQRWNATYTKHTKQKRKVYQDGFLELHISTKKVMLYDDCEKLLECRILKEDEMVRSGETLAFNGYLVDVGDLEGDHKPLSDLNSQGSDTKITEKAGLLHGKKFGNRTVSFDRKNDVGKNKTRPSWSPSQKIIREFKKSELHKYNVAQSIPDTTNASTTEWQVLYTTHVTQKAKKYHDGFLRLAACGSIGRQIMLFDNSRKLLNSRFLKKDEAIRAGESIAFDAHLVEIGEPNGDHKPLVDVNDRGNNHDVIKESRTLHHRENCMNHSSYIGKEFKKSEQDNEWGAPERSPVMSKPSLAEWQVLYTAQLIQKAKKYHDGFLRLVICGFQGRQVLLYDANRRLLDSRFLKKDEVIRSGESIAFDAYLIDIGEPVGKHKPLMDFNIQGNDASTNPKSGLIHGQHECHRDKKSIVKEWHALYTRQTTRKAKKYHNGIVRVSLCGSFRMQVSLLNEDKTILSSKFVSLSEDVRTGSQLELPKYLVEVGELFVSSEGAPQNSACCEKETVSNFRISGVDEIKLISRVPTTKSLRDAHQILSILQKPTALESNVGRYIDKSAMELISSTTGPQAADTDMVDFPEDNQPSGAPLEHHESSEKAGIGNFHDLLSSKANGSESSKGVNLGNSHQPHLDKVESGTEWCEGVFPFGKPGSSACASHGPIDHVNKTLKEHTCTMEVQEGPSFDLGF